MNRSICIAVFGFALLVALLMLALPCGAMAEGIDAAAGLPVVDVGEPMTWEYLATIAGASVFTLLIVQFCKMPLDRVWKIPTRVLVYVIALGVMLLGTAFTTGLTAQSALLAAVNAVIAALTAMGGYEVTFKKLGK